MTWNLSPSGLIVPTAEFAAPKKPVMGEVAHTLDGMDITRGWVDPMRLATPDDPVLMARGYGDYSLYREVLRDDRVKSAVEQRFRAVIARPYEVEPGGKRAIDKKAADFLEAQLDQLRWDAITEKMLYGVFYGHAVAEVLWQVDGNRIGIADIKVRDRRRFGFDGAGRLRLKTQFDPEGMLLPERKFWHFATGADHDDAPYGLGLAHWLYWPVWLKRNGVKFWATFLEKFATPTAVGRFPPGTSPADQRLLLEALQAIQRDSAIIFPEGMVAELLEAKRSGSADHESFVRLCNDAITIITIGQTASTQGTPGKLGNEEGQNDVRADITQADADLVCMSFNATVARWLTEYNFPGAEPPRVWRIMDDEEDLNTRAERDERLDRIGYRPSLDMVREIYGEGYEAKQTSPAEPEPVAQPAPTAEPEPAPAPAFSEAALADALTRVFLALDDTPAQFAEPAATPVPSVHISMPAPNVTVNLPDGLVRNDITVDVPEAPAPVVQVTVPDGPAPVVNVAAPQVTVAVPPRQTVTEIERDDAGNIVRAVQTDSGMEGTP